MSTATMLRRAETSRTFSAWVSGGLAAFSAKIGDIFSRRGSAEPKNESWRYFSA